MKKLILFKGDQLWVRRCETGADCFFKADPSRFETVEPIGKTAYAAAAEEPPATGAELVGLRAFFDLAPADAVAHASLARQLLHWRQTHRFCGVCGTPLTRHAQERAMLCAACGHIAYPRINPVVITLVHRGDQILLAHKAGGLYPFWSLVAGFVEANEALEETVVREIAEEVGVSVKNIRYAASQPWPYPNNLMIGFTAEYAGGEVTPDGDEIAEAGWFDRDHLPPIPTRVSIARRLIDAFFAQ